MGARALLAHLPTISSIWEGTRQGKMKEGEEEKKGTTIEFVTLILEKITYITSGADNRDFFSILTLLILLAFL